MTTINPTLGRLLAGVGGALLIVSLFMTWLEFGDGGNPGNGWKTLPAIDVLIAISGALGIAAALSGGRRGFFRPDVSLNGTADMVAVVTTIVIAAWLLADVPKGASAQAGSYVALVAAIVTACGAGDFKIRSLFPRMDAQAE
jgi:hypothetical protein